MENNFIIESATLTKLKQLFLDARSQILSAIQSGRQIVIRHHNDCDGYSAAIALEKAIIPLIENLRTNRYLQRYYMRIPSHAPFYSITDSLKDTSRALMNKARFGKEMPLVIILDNGSSEEDLLGIRQGKIYGMKFIVIDHHFFKEDMISDEVLVHINPLLVEKEMNFSAGMLGVELALFLNPEVSKLKHLAALSAIADRVDPGKYLALAEKEGYSREELSKVSKVVDYVIVNMPFVDGGEYMSLLFGDDRKMQQKTVALLLPELERLEQKAIAIGKDALQEEKIGDITLASIDVHATYPRMAYPKMGRIVGLLHDTLDGKVVTIGTTESSMTIRAKKEAGFSLHGFIDLIKKEIPKAFVEGGGHECAGTIHFVPSTKKSVEEALKKYLSK
jgi:archaea-specific RecJ-like exonuclease